MLRKLIAAGSALAGAATLSACMEMSPRLEYVAKSPSGTRIAHVAVEPNGHGFGLMSVEFATGRREDKDPWGEIQVLYHAKLGWVDDRTFAIVGDEIMYGQRTGDDYTDSDFPGSVRIVTCNRREADCSALEKRLHPNTMYVVNFQSGLATLEERRSNLPIVQVPPLTPPSAPRS